jgi:uncharacterized protein YutD
LTGLGDINEAAENKIIESLNKALETGKKDDELSWMLNYYYYITEWAFERLKSFKAFDSEITDEKINPLPEKIDREEMKMRRQMGHYWNSLSRFSAT